MSARLPHLPLIGHAEHHGMLPVWPSRDDVKAWPMHSTLHLEYVTIPQAPCTYAHLGSSPYWCWGYEEGINEYGVVIGNEALVTGAFREAARADRGGEALQCGLLG